MRALRTLPVAARLCVFGVCLSALGCVMPAVLGWVPLHWPKLVVLAVLYAACELITRCPIMGDKAPSGMGSFVPVLLAAVIMLPPSCAALVAVPGALVGQVGQSPKWVRRVWHAAQLAVSSAVAAQTYHWLGGHVSATADGFPLAIARSTLAALVFWLVSGVLVTGVLVTAERSRPLTALGAVLIPSFAPYLAYGVVGLTMGVLWDGPDGPYTAVLALLPMYVSCWVYAQYHRERAAHHATIRALVQAVDLKDEYTRGHSERVGRASVMIGREIGMSEERVDVLRFAGILHDVGKIGVPTRLLRKAGPLTAEERAVVERHPEYGHDMVRGISFLREARQAILHHHERIDGSGYPFGLSGSEIPQIARVVAVADAFDAMTSTRSYRRARPVSAAMEELKRCAGSQFDPRMVAALAAALEQDGWVVRTAEDRTGDRVDDLMEGERTGVVSGGTSGQTSSAPTAPPSPAALANPDLASGTEPAAGGGPGIGLALDTGPDAAHDGGRGTAPALDTRPPPSGSDLDPGFGPVGSGPGSRDGAAPAPAPDRARRAPS